MIHKAYFDFQAPEHGWLPVELRLDDFYLAMNVSDVGNDAITELLDLLACCSPAGSQQARVSFWLEPAGYILEASRYRQAEMLQVKVFYEENLYLFPKNNPPVFEGELPVTELRQALTEGFEKLFRCSVDSETAWTQKSDWADYQARFEALVAL